MASPVTLHIISNSGLKVTFDIPKYKLNSSDKRKGISYRVSDDIAQQFPFKSVYYDSKQYIEGFMSPVSPLTLPPKGKQKAGIGKHATTYAFLHPPAGLAKLINWEKVKVEYDSFRVNPYFDLDHSVDEESNCMQRFSCLSKKRDLPSSNSNREVNKEWAYACFSVLGAFIYFDDAYKIVSVNILSLSPRGATSELRMEGPYKVEDPKMIQELKLLDRFKTIPLKEFHEGGYVAKVGETQKKTYKMKISDILCVHAMISQRFFILIDSSDYY